MDVAVVWLRWVCTVEVVGYLQKCQERGTLVDGGDPDDYTVRFHSESLMQTFRHMGESKLFEACLNYANTVRFTRTFAIVFSCHPGRPSRCIQRVSNYNIFLPLYTHSRFLVASNVLR